MIKRIIHRTALLVTAALVFSAVTTSAAIRVIENDVAGFRIAYSSGESDIDSVTVGDRDYLSWLYPGHALPGTPGAPMLPSETVYFVAPAGTIPTMTVSAGSRTNYSPVLLAPVPTLQADPAGYTSEAYIPSTEPYARSGWQPSSHAILDPTVDKDGLTIWRITCSPLLFDAYRRTVEEIDGLDITVSIPGSFAGMSMGVSIPTYAINEQIVRQQLNRSGVQKVSQTSDDPFSFGEWYKIKISESGMYRVSGGELTQAGFMTGTIPSSSLHLYYGGGRMLDESPSTPSTDAFQEVAITVNDGGDGVFDTTDSFYFYGEALTRFEVDENDTTKVHRNFLYADIGENCFWLQVYQGQIPKRIGSKSGQPSFGAVTRSHYRETIHLEPENYIEIVDSYGAESGLEWYWEAIGNKTKSFTFDAPGRVSGGEPILRLGFRIGMSISNNTTKLYRNHYIAYTLNDVFGIFQLSADSYKTTAHEMAFESPLKTATNILELSRENSPSLENVRLDWLEVEYDRNLTMSSNLEFFHKGTAEPTIYTISNAYSSVTDIYDTTDPYDVSLITEAAYNASNSTLSFQPDTETKTISRYTVIPSKQYKTISSVTKKKHTNLRNPSNSADYIIITHGNFHDSAVTLANWRAHDSVVDPLATMVVDIGDIYDEFSWGIEDPVAIRDYLHYAWLNYNQGQKHVSYCCLFGDTTYRFKNTANQVEKNYVPSYTAFRDYDGIITDDFFSWFDENEIPEIAMGRICVADPDMAESIVEKTIAYERDAAPGRWHNRIVYIADDEFVFAGRPDKTNLFTKDVETLDNESGIPESFERDKILLIEYPMSNNEKPAVTTDLFKEINEGCLIVNFVGHGNNDVLAHENILRGSRDMDKFANGPRQPVFLAFSCTVGKFDKPGIASLTETMHLKTNGGCIATISSARTTYNDPNMQLNKLFYQNLFGPDGNPEYRLGPALLAGKQYLAKGPDKNAQKYFLFGDPATRLMMPRATVAAAVPDTLVRLRKYEVNGEIVADKAVTDEITLRVTAQGPRQHLIYKNPDTDGITFSYTKPGKPFFRGDFTMPASDVNFTFIIPKDVQSDLSTEPELQRESKILLYASGESFEAAGAVDNLLIGDIDPAASDDTAGPSVTLAFDGKNHVSGDIIRRQPEITVEISDPSGVNIAGMRGHNIKMLVDRTESVVLTDYYIAKDGVTNGSLTYTLPMLSVGEHEFEISAYDSFNNTSKATVTATVAGSETGDIAIHNLLNYPNPMANDGTTFTFNLTDFAQHASIKIYSQSGRLVDSISFPAEYGFNTVFWAPPVVLANGVYFYKLSVTSSNGRKSSKIEKLVVMR